MGKVNGPILSLMSLLFAVTLQSHAEDRFDTVSVRTWDTVKDADVFPPELKDGEISVPWLRNRPSFGIAFSGGGTRSATATLGQLRALHHLGWLKHAQYISANSGGTWTTVPYTYLPAKFDEQRFLGKYVSPEEIDDHTLKPENTDLMAMGTAIHNATTGDKFLAGFRGDEAYSDIIGSIFLQPFGLHDKKNFFTFHRGALQKILHGNPHLRQDDFYVVEREDRPYLILVGTMLAEQHSKDPSNYFPVEMTPLYTGIRERFSFMKDGETVIVGGGYVESFGYDSYEPAGTAKDGRWEVRLKGQLWRGDNPFSDRYQFTLSDAMGVSSAAPLVTLTSKKIPNLVFPELRHWPIDRESITRGGSAVCHKADEFQHGDGGDIDNLSVMPLLARSVSNILVFINTAQPFIQPEGGCNNISEKFIKDDLVSLFRISGKLVHNVVIQNGEQELRDLCRTFVTKKATKQPLTYCQSYNVATNTRHGIEPYRPNICWVYLDRVENWLQKVNKSSGRLNRKLHDKDRPFDNFPHYATFAEKGALLIDLDRERVNALSNLTAWVVYESAEPIRRGLPSINLPVLDE